MAAQNSVHRVNVGVCSLAGFASLVPAITGLVSLAWSLSVALAANPIGLLVIALAAAAVGFYELYKHFDYVKHLGSVLYDAGAHLIDQLIGGIMSKVASLGHAMTNVGTAIRRFLPFSPAKEGPLRDLNRIRFVETIAASIRPAPMIDAIRKVAAASAIAIPLAIGGGAGQVMARTGGGASASGAGITVNVTVNYSIAPGAAETAGDFRKLLEDHADTIGKVVARNVARAERLKLG